MTLTISRTPRLRPPVPATAPFASTLTAFTLTAILVSGQLYVVIPLLHDMAAGWGSSAGGLTWLVTAFGIGYGVGFLVFGPLSDRYGRRRVLMIGLPLAALTTALVALSPSPEVALGLRALQGVAVAMFPPAAMAYLGERLEPRRRVAAIAAVTGAFLASAVVLQVAAQLLVEVIGWRGLFGISAAGFVVAWLGVRAVMLPDPPRDRTETAYPVLETPRPGPASAPMAPASARSVPASDSTAPASARSVPASDPTAPASAGGGRHLAGSLLSAYRPLPGLLFHRVLTLRYLATIMLMVGFVAVYTGLQIYGVSSPAELLALRAAGLPSIVLVPLLMPWLARIRMTTRAVAFLAVAALTLAVIGLTGTAVLVLLLALYVAAITGGLPSMNESISAEAGQARGTALALFSAALAVGGSVGPQVAAAFGGFTPLMYGLAIGMATAALFILVSTWTAGKKRTTLL